MKPTPPAAAKTLAEFKIIQSFFMKSGSQVPRDESSIDWSTDTPEVQLMPTSRVSSVGRNMLSPHTPLHNRNAKGKGRIDSIDSNPSLLNYGGNQPSIPSSWDKAHHALSIFGTDQTPEIDARNIAQSITWIIDYIKNNLADKKPSVREFEHVTKSFWDLITAIYSSRWDLLSVEDGKTFHILVGKKILNNYTKLSLVKQPKVSKPQPSMPTITIIPNIPASPPPSKMTGLNEKKASKPMFTKKSYAQASKFKNLSSIEDVI